VSETGSEDQRDYLTPTEAATILRVSPQTVSRWAKEGRIGCQVTLGGHRRFLRDEVTALAEQGSVRRADPDEE
jgi:excisionase family DNA binding protein